MGDSHNINNGMGAADDSGDTLGLQDRRRPRVEACEVPGISQINLCCHKKHIITYSYILKQGRAEKRRHHTHPWIYGSCVGAWLGPFSVLQYATADGCGGQSPGNRRRSSEHDHMHAWYTIKKSSSTTKRPCSSPPKFLVTYGADNNKSSVCTLET